MSKESVGFLLNEIGATMFLKLIGQAEFSAALLISLASLFILGFIINF